MEEVYLRYLRYVFVFDPYNQALLLNAVIYDALICQTRNRGPGDHLLLFYRSILMVDTLGLGFTVYFYRLKVVGLVDTVYQSIFGLNANLMVWWFLIWHIPDKTLPKQGFKDIIQIS